MAEAFARAGARVILAARHADRVAEAAKALGCEGLAMDVTLPEDWARARRHVAERYGRIDVLINNAGGGVAIKEVAEQTVEELDAAIRLNLCSVLYAARAFAPMLKEQRHGTVIHIASVCARHSWPGWSVYAAAKAGVLQFSKGFYTEMQPYRVRVSCILPAAASTGFQRGAGIGEVVQELAPEDIAQTALYIAKLPPHAVVEDVTVWGIDQVVTPL